MERGASSSAKQIREYFFGGGAKLEASTSRLPGGARSSSSAKQISESFFEGYEARSNSVQYL